MHHRDDAVMRECNKRSTTTSSTLDDEGGDDDDDDDDDDFNNPWGDDNLRLARSMVSKVEDSNKVTPRNLLFAKQRELTNEANVIKTLSSSDSSGKVL